MKKIILFTILTLLSVPLFSESLPITATELIENTKVYDKKEIISEGEVIGDIFYKEDYVWIHVFDGQNAIGIWLPKHLIESLSPLGDYSHKGDWVQVRGKFHRYCKEHLGETDIHAESLIVLQKGCSVTPSLDHKKLSSAIILFSLAVILTAWEIFRRKKRKEE